MKLNKIYSKNKISLVIFFFFFSNENDNIFQLFFILKNIHLGPEKKTRTSTLRPEFLSFNLSIHVIVF